MSGKEASAGSKRKAKVEDADDADGQPAKVPKASKKKKSDEPKPPKKVAVRKKPYTPEEERMAAGASMERNKAVVAFLKTVEQQYIEEKLWFKKASAMKAHKAIDALTEPFKVPKDLLSLDGCGKGTVEKIEAFLLQNPGASSGSAGAGSGSSSSAGSGAGYQKGDPEFQWVESSERDVVIGCIKSGEVPLAKVLEWRDDITAADVDE